MLLRNTSYAICLTLLLAVLACDRPGQEKATKQLSEAREETRGAAHEAKREAQKLAGEIKAASERTQTNGVEGAEAKLDRGERSLQLAGQEAGGKLDQAAILAKVKAKLASDVGVGTVASIDVNVAGRVVTLRGHVSSSEQKTRVEEAVKEIPSVASVVNRLTVEP